MALLSRDPRPSLALVELLLLPPKAQVHLQLQHLELLHLKLLSSKGLLAGLPEDRTSDRRQDRRQLKVKVKPKRRRQQLQAILLPELLPLRLLLTRLQEMDLPPLSLHLLLLPLLPPSLLLLPALLVLPLLQLLLEHQTQTSAL